jgi:drug/metabolite transporter (DMT)-like permease
VLALAIVAVSHGSIFVRLADSAPFATAAWRLTLASFVVVPLALVFDRPAFTGLDRRLLTLIAGAGLLLAGHFATWITSLQYTSIGNSVVLVTTAPVWVGIIGALTGTLALTRRMWLAVALSVLGSIVIGWGSARLGTATLRGDLLALVGAVCLGGYLLLAQRVQRKLTFLPFVALVYASAAAFLWIGALATGTTLSGFDAGTWWALIGIALVSQVIGHSGYNWSLRHLNPDIVSVTLLGEPILASLLGLLFFREAIPPTTLAGGALVLAAIVIAAHATREERAAVPAAQRS